MKIKQLDIQGFRSLKDVSWKPGDLNVVIGPNGSGKSNLLRMLELISVAAQGRLDKYILASGGMGALLWDGQANEVKYQVKASSSEGLLGEELPLPYFLGYEVELNRLGKGSWYRVGHELYRVAKEMLVGDVIEDLSDARYFTHLERLNDSDGIFDEERDGGLFVRTVRKPGATPTETLLSEIAGPFPPNRWIGLLREYLSSWSIYHDVRVDRDAPVRQAAVTRYETRVDPDGQNLVPVLNTLYMSDRRFKEDINAAMSVAFGDEFQELVFVPDAAQRIQLAIRWKSLRRDVPAADLSDGTLRFLFLATVLGSPSPPPLIAIDEPETGLHPNMFPIIAEFAVDAAERSQVIFTTHSDQFLSAFRNVRPTTTVAQCVDGETTLHVVDDEWLAYWLQEYSLGELYRSGQLEQMV